MEDDTIYMPANETERQYLIENGIRKFRKMKQEQTEMNEIHETAVELYVEGVEAYCVTHKFTKEKKDRYLRKTLSLLKSNEADLIFRLQRATEEIAGIQRLIMENAEEQENAV